MNIRFKHTNLVAEDWRKLSGFYQKVFHCVPVPPERHLSGDWLTQGTGVKDAEFSGVHLLLPGFGKGGPTLEIYQYGKNESKPSPVANREGFAHIAFEVADVAGQLERVIKHGGTSVGKVVSREVIDVGKLTFVYAADPEGNIIELQNWS
jgi:glyoxylase I family protein